MTNLYTLFKNNLKQNEDRIFLIYDDKEFSWKWLGQLVDSISSKLAELDVSPYDRIGIMIPNCPEYIAVLIGIWKIGAVSVPINTYLKHLELASIIEDAGISVLFTSSNLLKNVDEARKITNKLKKILVVGKIDKEDHIYEPFPIVRNKIDVSNIKEPIEVSPSDTALLIYTSGTTGNPKGVELTHKNLISNLHAIHDYIKFDSEDWFLIFLPMFHSFTLTTSILLPMCYSAKVVILQSIHPEKIMKSVRTYPISLFIGIPAIYKIMVDERYNIPSEVFKNIKYFVSGSAPLPVQILEKFHEKFKTPIQEGYGMSETSPVVSLNPRDRVKFGSVGKSIPGVSVRIFNNEGIELDAGEIGEIMIQGDNVMKGYFNKPLETEKAFIDSWLKTGDLGFIDEDEYIHIVGRSKEMMIVAGINVYPQEIENVLSQHPSIDEAAVIGIPDPGKGELPLAFVKLKENMQITDDLKIFCRERLASYKVPCYFEFVKDFPRNATGKILKRTLNYKQIN